MILVCKMEVVIARYNESLKWMRNMDFPRCVIYNKGETMPGTIQRPNIGREAETYLYHIITNYESLADWTLFLQGNPLDHSRELKWVPPAPGAAGAGFIPLNPKRTVLENYDATLRPETFYLPVYKKLSALGMAPDSFVQVEFPAGAQFAVSKERIRARPKAFYEELHHQLHIGPEFAQYDMEYYRRPDYNHERLDAWILERLWPLIFAA